MEQSSFQGKLIRSTRDAAAIKVHSKEDPPDFKMRSTKVFAWDRRPSQAKAIFQVTIADGRLFYGNYALRSRGGCCICLLMASGLTAKRFSMWVADAEEGKFYYTISSERFKLSVFIILPRVVYTSHQCVSQSEMDDNRSGGHENITKDFLTYAVRHLSRLYVDKTKGQEVCWKYRPPNWPEHLTWKNPTSSPKDSTKTLREKYDYLRSQVPSEKLSPEEQNAIQDFEAGNTGSVKDYMSIRKLNDYINGMRNELHCLHQPHQPQIDTLLKLLDQASSQVSSLVASTNRRPAAADTSSPTLSKKRKHVSPKSVQSKKCKTEMPNYSNNIQNNCRKIIYIFPKSTQTTPNEFLTVCPQGTGLAQLSAVESSVRNTFPHQSQQSLVSSNNTLSNTCIDNSNCTTLPDHPETAAATYNPLFGSQELFNTISDSIPITSLDSGTWSQESNIFKEACDVRLDEQKLNDKVVQDYLQYLEDSSNTTDQNYDFDTSIFMNVDTYQESVPSE